MHSIEDIVKTTNPSIEKIEKHLQAIITNNGTEPDGIKLISLFVNYKGPFYGGIKKYKDVKKDELLKFLHSSTYRVPIESSGISLENSIDTDLVYFIFYIWIHYSSFLATLSIVAPSVTGKFGDKGAFCLQQLFSSFNAFKNKLDGHDIETVPRPSTQDGGNTPIKLTFFLILLLGCMIPFIVSPGNSKAFDQSTPIIVREAKQLVEYGETNFNNVSDQFIYIIDKAQTINHATFNIFGLIQDSTVDGLKEYHKK